MARLLSLRTLCLVAVLVCSTSGTWWNSRKWRSHWLDWWRDRQQQSVEQTRPTQMHLPLQKDDVNVCVVKVPIAVTQECSTERGRRRLKCRTKQFYRTDYACCPGYAREEGKPGCPKELYVSKLNIVELAKSLGLSEFVKLVNLAGIASELVLDTKYTAFIPSNEAFQALPSDTMSTLLKNPQQLGDLLLFHVVPNKVVADALKNNMMLKSMDVPNKIRVNVDKLKKITVVQGAKIVTANQGASNGVVHVIDNVMLPSSGTLTNYLKGNPQLSIFYEMLLKSGIDITNTTVFAPSNSAFQALPAGRLDRLRKNSECAQKFSSYHVVNAQLYSQLLTSCRTRTEEGSFIEVKQGPDNTSLLVNDAMVTSRDVTADDGIVHVLGKVLMPFGAMDIVEAVKSLNLTTLARLLEKSGLANTLATSDTPWTLFAPTDKAFSALSAAVLDQISNDPKKLKTILRYHVIDKRVWTYEFGRDTFVDSFEGTKLRLNTFRFGKVHAVNGACLKSANLETCNGVIHVITRVLIPEERSIYDVLRSEPRFSTLVRILEQSTLVPLLKNTTRSFTLFAPANQAFERLQMKDADLLSIVEKIPSEADRMLRTHLVDRTYYSCALECKYSYWSLFARRFAAYSMAETILRLKAPWNDVMSVNRVRVRHADVMAINGVIHELEEVLPWSPVGYRQARSHARRRHGWHRIVLSLGP